MFRTNFNRIFYGSTLSTNTIEIRSISSHQAEHIAISTDNTGSFWSFSIPLTYAGFVESSGSILMPSKGLPFILKRKIAIEFEKANLDESSGLTLIPMWTGENTMQFYVNGSNLVTKDLSGYKIIHENGGEFSISHVSQDGKVLYGNIKSLLVPETDTASPATSGNLTILGVANKRDMIEKGLPTQPTNYVELIVSNFTENGWLLSDIGKTVIFHLGSILITKITNYTHATGMVVLPPISTADAPVGTWSLYDFRSFSEHPTTFRQNLTVLSNSSGSFGYISPGLLPSYSMIFLF